MTTFQLLRSEYRKCRKYGANFFVVVFSSFVNSEAGDNRGELGDLVKICPNNRSKGYN